MWNKFISYIKLLISYKTRLEDCENDIRDLHQRVYEISAALNMLALKNEYQAKQNRAEYENFILQVENRFLKMENRLPPSNN